MSEKLKIGVFGLKRGSAYIKAVNMSDIAEVTAVCDFDESLFENMKPFCAEGCVQYKDYDEFIEKSGIDAVVLCNYFNCHAEFAVKAMEKGIHVLSETTAASTLRECADLCRTVEKTGCIYGLAENYPYMLGPTEMRNVFLKGTLGEVLYAEGEYIHPFSQEDKKHYVPNNRHWRAYTPSCYYLTHSVAPLMYATELMPIAVNAKSTYSRNINIELDGEPKTDSGCIMLCEMDNGAIFRVAGWSTFAPHGNWYRLSCENGGIEMVRGDEEKLRLTYNHWSKPDGAETSKFYEAPQIKAEESEKAANTGHGGGDYWVTMDFLKCLLNKTNPFFDVYRACTMAALGIFAWRSSLNNGAEYKIPDFRDERQRKQIENDILSPYPDENGNANYPCSDYEEWDKKHIKRTMF